MMAPMAVRRQYAGTQAGAAAAWNDLLPIDGIGHSS